MLFKLIYIALGGALGTLSRYGVSCFAIRFGSKWNWGTFLANIIGCFVIGGLWAYWQNRTHLPEEMRLFIFVGFLGAFTTFSTYMLENVHYLRDGNFMMAGSYILGSTLVGMTFLFLGIYMGSRI